MTTRFVSHAPDVGSGPLNELRWMLRDSWTVVRRNLTQMRHSPGEIMGVIIFPIIMIVIFGYIFGSAITVPGGTNYREYLMPGLFAMSATVGVMVTLGRVARDNGEGVMDRFRSMPMARSAVPFGQTGADLVVSLLSFSIMAACGLAVGWRAHNGALATLAGFGILLLFSWTLNWIGALLGLLAPDQGTAERWTPLVFPLTMISNVFVPTGGLPAWLAIIADWNPVSAVTAAARELFGNPGAVAANAWPMQHPVVAAIGWCVVLLAVVIPLCVHRYSVAGR